MKQPIRYFSIGLLTASFISLIVFVFFHQPRSQENLSIDDMISEIENEGYHVLTESDYITFSVNKDNNGKTNDDDQSKENSTQSKKEKDEKKKNEKDKEKEKKEEEKDSKEKEEIYTYTLVVEPNMLGPTISNLLHDHNIIDDAEEFNRYLEVEGYAPYIQIGEHKLSSDMTYYEIAETIARSQ